MSKTKKFREWERSSVMHYFLAVFFFILGTAGLILRNNTGVFAGLGLFPLEMVKISGGKRVGIVFIIVST
ncbi:MAG: hypothetical protein GX175_07460, partial [Halanaerobiaceae bacterium]|nr:hypothetical protein [Halanaerobiaceae bacterium]